MTIAGAPLASAPEQNSAYARNKEGRFGKPGRPSLFFGKHYGITKFSKLTELGRKFFDKINKIYRIQKVAVAGPRDGAFFFSAILSLSKDQLRWHLAF
jgi:hypothetical protein